MTRSLRTARVPLLTAEFFLALLAPQAVAQEPEHTLRDDPESRALDNLVISADGAWVAAEERSDRGEASVRVWSTKGDVTYSIERGQHPRISRDSRWVSALRLRHSGPARSSEAFTPKLAAWTIASTTSPA